MMLLSMLAILLFILVADVLYFSFRNSTKLMVQGSLVVIWSLIWFFNDAASHKLSSAWELIPFLLGILTLLFLIYLNYLHMHGLHLEIETQKNACQEHIQQVETFHQIKKTTQDEIDFLNLQLDQASKIYNSTLAMSTSLDFHATLSAFVKSLSHLEGFKTLSLILAIPPDDHNGSTHLIAYQVTQDQKNMEAYSVGDVEKKLFQHIQTLPPIQRIFDPESFALPPSSFGISAENPAWIVPLTFLKECTGVLVYFHKNLLHPGSLELLSMHFSMEVQKTRLYEKIKRLSTTDAVSGAYLKRYFFPLFDEEIARHKILGEKLAVLMMDIDNFKSVNDQYGHLMGDRVIKEIGQCIKKELREEDLICRFGGDEFVVVLPKSSKEQVIQVTERLQKSIQGIPFHADNQEEFRISMSLGISCFPEDGVGREELIEVADQRLYKFKKSTLPRMPHPILLRKTGVLFGTKIG
jgi:diguanylate cyclase (GGDEF)-like protein